MDKAFQQILRDITQLNRDQQKSIFNVLNKLLSYKDNSEAELIEVKKKLQEQTSIVCPHCKSDDFIGYGKYREMRRYKCKSCGRTFNDLTGTSISHIHKKEKWSHYLECMSEGMSLKKTAKIVGISYRTAFLWRHKILGSFQDTGCSKLEGIVESDETFFLFSEKGDKQIVDRDSRKRGGEVTGAGINKNHVAVVVASDRNNNLILEVAGRSRVSAEKIDKAIGKWLSDNTIAFCSDAHGSYRKFANDRGLKHQVINASKGQHVKDEIYHIQHVNNIHSRVKNWIFKFNGVASKYLQNYMNWFRIGLLSDEDPKEYLKYSITSNFCYLPVNKIKTHYFIL